MNLSLITREAFNTLKIFSNWTKKKGSDICDSFFGGKKKFENLTNNLTKKSPIN